MNGEANLDIGNMTMSGGKGFQLMEIILAKIHLELAVFYSNGGEVILFPAPVHSGDGGHLLYRQRRRHLLHNVRGGSGYRGFEVFGEDDIGDLPYQASRICAREVA
jgi:hypothetical protein